MSVFIGVPLSQVDCVTDIRLQIRAFAAVQRRASEVANAVGLTFMALLDCMVKAGGRFRSFSHKASTEQRPIALRISDRATGCGRMTTQQQRRGARVSLAQWAALGNLSSTRRGPIQRLLRAPRPRKPKS